jgi:peptidoglycan/LPS O-acetylase OafA/YrhL
MWMNGPMPHKEFCPGKFEAAAICAFSNLFIIGQDALRFTLFNPQDGLYHFVLQRPESFKPGYGFIVLGQSWSLALEIMFYALVPFILRKSTAVVATLMAGSLLLKICIQASFLPDSNSDWNYAFFPAELGVFLAGALAFRYRKKFSSLAILMEPRALAIFVFAGSMSASYRYGNLVFIGMTVFLLPKLFRERSLLDKRAGECSYPIYMIHMFFIDLLKSAGWTNTISLILATAILSTAFAAIYILWFDEPLTRFRHHAFRRPDKPEMR